MLENRTRKILPRHLNQNILTYSGFDENPQLLSIMPTRTTADSSADQLLQKHRNAALKGFKSFVEREFGYDRYERIFIHDLELTDENGLNIMSRKDKNHPEKSEQCLFTWKHNYFPLAVLYENEILDIEQITASKFHDDSRYLHLKYHSRNPTKLDERKSLSHNFSFSFCENPSNENRINIRMGGEPVWFSAKGTLYDFHSTGCFASENIDELYGGSSSCTTGHLEMQKALDNALWVPMKEIVSIFKEWRVNHDKLANKLYNF